MAKKLPRSMAHRTAVRIDADDPVLKEARARYGAPASTETSSGGAWAQAGASVMSTELQKLQDERIERLLSGNLVFEIGVEQVEDTIGSDRSNKWIEEESFEILKNSIRQNGQDVPVQVVPLDPAWQPAYNETDGIVLKGVRFSVVSGRRRVEALRQLGRKVKAVCAQIVEERPSLDQLHRRYRENVERENLSLFDEFLAVGEMFSHEKARNPDLTARAFARALAVPEPKLSRGRAIYDNRERLFAELAAPQSLTLHQLDRIIPALRAGDPLPDLDGERSAPRSGAARAGKGDARPAVQLKRTQIIKGRKIVAKARNGKITLDLGTDAGVNESFLDKLLLFIQTERGR